MAVGTTARSLGRVTTILLFSRILGYALTLLNSIVIARALGASRLGEYAYAMGIAGLFGLIPHMGISTIVTRAVALNAADGPAVLRTAMAAQALLAGAVLLVIPLVAVLLPRQPVPLIYVGLAATQLAIGALSWPYLAVVGGHARYDRLALAEVVSAATTTALLLAVALLRPGVLMFLTAQTAGAVAAVAAARWVARPFLSDPGSRRVTLGELFRQAAPFGATAAVQGVYTRIDTVLLGQLASTAALGLYNVAYKPATLAVSVGATVSGTLFPVLARPPQAGVPPSFVTGMRTLGLAAPAMALALCGLAEPLLGLLYGEAFRAATPLLWVLAWAAAAHWLYAPLAVALQARGRERAWLAATLAALGLNAAGNLYAIPRWGAWGAASATLVSEAVLVATGLVLVWRALRFPIPARTIATVALAAGAGWATLSSLAPRGAIAATTAALLVYAAVLVVGRLVGKEDAAMAGGWVRDAVLGEERR